MVYFLSKFIETFENCAQDETKSSWEEIRIFQIFDNYKFIKIKNWIFSCAPCMISRMNRANVGEDKS